MKNPFKQSAVVASHNGSKRIGMTRVPLSGKSTGPFESGSGRWEIALDEIDPDEGIYQLNASVLEGEAREAAWGLSFVDTDWSVDNYVLIPGAVYAGNRFHSERYDYSPPKIGPAPDGIDRTPWIGDLPRLNLKPGTSHLDQMSIDASTPGIGIYFPDRGKALCILTAQHNEWGPFGLEVIENDERTEAEILLMSPGFRKEKYYSFHNGYLDPSMDRAADFRQGDRLGIEFRLFWVDCESVQALFHLVFKHRYDCFQRTLLKKEISFSATWDSLEEKHNRENWREEDSLYQVSINNDPPNVMMYFQTGWVGGMITPYAMLQEGTALSSERALKNMDMFYSGAQTPFGLYHEYYFEGKWLSKVRRKLNVGKKSEFISDPNEQWTLVRRIGDILFFGIREFEILRNKGHGERIRPEWLAALEKNLVAIKTVWERNGEFGQYIDVNSGEVMVAGSTAAALIPAGMVLAADFLGEAQWIQLAEEIAEKFRVENLAAGICTGGPGDCVQAPDSESIAALVDSFILLYEKTGKSRWLEAAEDAVVQFATWVISYNYEFPQGTALKEAGAQTRGTLIANAQNKTGVPGICTLSGQSIFRLFRATGNCHYLRLLGEVAHSIPQFLGREDKKIPTRLSWGRKGVTELPEGWICERVNITQWGEEIGEVAAYSCWCEVAMMLTWCDIPGIYLQPDTELLWVSDHVETKLIKESGKVSAIRITNPTNRDARVRCMVESSKDAAQALDINFAAKLPIIKVAAGESLSVPLNRLDHWKTA